MKNDIFSMLFDKNRILNSGWFDGLQPFELLGKGLETFLINKLRELGVSDRPVVKGKVEEGAIVRGAVYIAEGAHVEPTAMIVGPTYIGPDCEVRHGAYVRGNVFASRACVLGHASEFKGAVLFDEAKAGHFAYVGDSILGVNVNLGAGTKIANLKLKGNEVFYSDPQSHTRVGSGLRKFGALLGDDSQTGCNAVLSPGSILGRKAMVLGCAHFVGTLGNGEFYTGKDKPMQK